MTIRNGYVCLTLFFFFFDGRRVSAANSIELIQSRPEKMRLGWEEDGELQWLRTDNGSE